MWAAWSSWTTCNTEGVKHRSRDCAKGAAECNRLAQFETRDCYSPGCPGMTPFSLFVILYNSIYKPQNIQPPRIYAPLK